MRKAAAILLLAGLACAAQAKEYWASRDVRYHIGDSRYGLSTDVEQMETYPVVGSVWEQGFTVDRPDTVRVRIDKIWGVDDCPYCKVIVSIDEWDMGRLTEENNHEPFRTLTPLARRVEPGRTYRVRVQSYASQGGRADDFVIADVVVETEEAEVTFIQGPEIREPDQPRPTPYPTPQPVRGDCRGSRQVADWLPSSAVKKGMLEMQGGGSFREQQLRAPLATGDYLEIYSRVKSVEQGDLVGQALELVLGRKDPSGWVISFPPGGTQPAHANLKLGGIYRAQEFSAGGFKPGQWNTLRLARCPDGKASLFLNGREVAAAIPVGADPQPIQIRIRGMKAELSAKPY